MAKDTSIPEKKKEQIHAIQATDDQLTTRSCLSFFAIYLRSIQLLPIIERLFGKLRKNKKGLPIPELFVQVLSFFMDGTSRHLTGFDQLKKEESYLDVVGSERLASSHAINRFFGAFSHCRVYLFRRLLQDLFIWRLKLTKPPVIILGIDTAKFFCTRRSVACPSRSEIRYVKQSMQNKNPLANVHTCQGVDNSSQKGSVAIPSW